MIRLYLRVWWTHPRIKTFRAPLVALALVLAAYPVIWAVPGV